MSVSSFEKMIYYSLVDWSLQRQKRSKDGLISKRLFIYLMTRNDLMYGTYCVHTKEGEITSVVTTGDDIMTTTLKLYSKHEYCLDVKCECLIVEGDTTRCLVKEWCPHTAKEFHQWIKRNGYAIAKVEVK